MRARSRSLVIRVAFVALVGLPIASCGTPGSGDLISETRQLGAFDVVSVSDGIDLVLTIDPGSTGEVVVTYDDNLIDRVSTQVSSGTLTIAAAGSFNITGGGRFVSVTIPDLTRLDASGGSDVAGNGQLATLDLDASGGADVDLEELHVEMLTIAASGGADVTVTALESIVGTASGGSQVTILGDPTVVDVETSGGADVN